MSTATLPTPKIVSSTGERLFTLQDLDTLPDQLPSGPVKYELLRGRLIPMAPPGDIHGFRQIGIMYYLYGAQLLGLGEARGEIGVVIARDPDTVLGPDAAFILKASLPVKRAKEGYLETIPEIVVEIRSKNDTKRDVQKKADAYFRAGVKEVWLLDPDAKTVAVNLADGNVQVFRGDNTLTSTLLPGFTAPLTALFAGE